MKRTELKRKTPLVSKTPLKSRTSLRSYSTLQSKTPLQSRTPLKSNGVLKSNSTLRPRSAKRIEDDKKYEKAKREYRKELIEKKGNDFCEYPGCYQEGHIHHLRGRVGKLLWDKSNFAVLCPTHHAWAHANEHEAVAMGLKKSRHTSDAKKDFSEN